MENDKLDLSFLIQKIYKKKKTLKIIFLVVFLVSLVYTFFLYEKKYESKIVFIPQSSQQNSLLSGLGGVASLAGINLKSKSTEVISPVIYSKIIESKPFLDKMANSFITITRNDTNSKITYKQYYKELPTSIFSRIKSIFDFKKKNKKEPVLSLPEVNVYGDFEMNVFKNIENVLRFKYEAKENIVTIESSFPQALASSELVINAVNILKEELRLLRNEKNENDLKFIEERYKEKYKEFKDIQILLASFEDKNQYLSSARSKIKQLDLRSRYDLLFNVCSELEKQIATKQLEINENTPFISIIEPVFIPIEKSGLSKKLLIIIGLLLSLFLSIFYVFVHDFYLKLKKSLFIASN
ncbi:Wzz/FepE/Etk N-terminal domain-containing protein [Tenacibaculum sp. HL-MS23]|uniref:Wzz/FepE/Etk N-terminal domain-containing protein n=1 Tax=unclassified Tenacibaculum TaxID=2635139 RepID=UPI001C4F2353|nr:MULTISPECIES: Wzz/FepE/Etk N-terminal domain-containing protein [unclassified Tenacibaculum]QXP74538.1 hypothetical protein H0I30_05165 [Tenacibaculum sp. AHE14PA]QXP75092.1 hypothetical protein H0I31_07800 [Tenacibaculum sp. AHE15PA]WNW01637.1 Wzz/FepE/Etk N-terminal domain-containing protein [Tenacibaculum sp. HL-MS23]